MEKNVKNMLYELVYRSYETGKIQQDFTKCVIVQIPKKQGQIHVNIELAFTCIKNSNTYCVETNRKHIDSLLTEDHLGFRKQRGRREAILRQVNEKQNRKSKPTYIAFVNLKKAFDNVK